MKLLTGILAVTLTGTAAIASANAADLSPGGGSLKDPYVPVAPWTGFYLGVSGGFGEGITHIDDYAGKTKFDNDTEGAIGGGQIGYNLQSGGWVYGLEADIGGFGLVSRTIEPANGNIAGTIDAGFYGDVTGRIGFLSGPRTLVYGKGGVAFFDGDLKELNSTNGGVAKTDNYTGWTLGGGIEHKFAPSWSFKAEYMFFDFGSETSTMSVDHDRYSNELFAHTLKFGFNYFVSPSYEPLK